jgi:hypothetical protein
MLYSVIWLLTRVPKNDWKNSTEAENSSNNHTETVNCSSSYPVQEYNAQNIG